MNWLLALQAPHNRWCWRKVQGEREGCSTLLLYFFGALCSARDECSP